MSEWYIGNSIVGNFRVKKEIKDPKVYRIEKYEGNLYLCKDNEKLLLSPIDGESENLINLFSNENNKLNESIYQIEKNNDVIAIVLYTYKDTKRISGSQSINIHLSNADEIACLEGQIKYFSADNKENITKKLKELFCINNSIFVLPEKDNKNFEIYGNKIQAHVRLERTGVYLLDRIRKITNDSKTTDLVQLFGNINFLLWEDTTSIQCNDGLELNDATPSEIFKSWDLYEKFIKDKYYEIKVTIRESHPPTWRRLRIPANITFNDLAAIIEIAFEWSGYHLYEFEVGATLHEMGQFIGVSTEDEYGIEMIRGKTLDSGKEKIDKYFKKYKRMKFVYDFGDNWVHDIIIEKEVNEKIEYPLCVKAKSGAYPEDCGGTWGYEEYYEEDKEERTELDIDFINDELENYKNFAKELYDREMF